MLVVVVLALVVVAVAKPWASSGPPPAPPVRLASPAASATPALSRTPAGSAIPSLAPATPPSSAPPAGPARIDLSAAEAALQPHDAWGIRRLVVQPDGSVREEWTPLYSSDQGRGATPRFADAYTWIGTNATIALGITAPLANLPLDVRAWRMSLDEAGNATGWRNLAVMGGTPSGDPSSRVLRLTEDQSDGNGWPAGQYQVDVLLEGGVTRIQISLFGNPGRLPRRAAPRAPPPIAQLRAIAGTPGAFIVSGTGTASYLFSGLPPSANPHNDFESWLALRSTNIFWAPGLYEPPAPVLGTASLLGVAVPEGQRFKSAELMEVAPVEADLGPAQIVAGLDGAAERPDAVALFRPSDPNAGFASVVYRIDGVVQTKRGLVHMSWDLPVVARSSSTESLLLAADRAWPNLPKGGWTVLTPGHRVRVTPSLTYDLTKDPGTTCLGGADLGTQPWYLGIAHPGAAFTNVAAWPLSGPSQLQSVPVQVSQLVDGFATIRPIASDWLPGRYVIVMDSQAKEQAITVCVE